MDENCLVDINGNWRVFLVKEENGHTFNFKSLRKQSAHTFIIVGLLFKNWPFFWCKYQETAIEGQNIFFGMIKYHWMMFGPPPHLPPPDICPIESYVFTGLLGRTKTLDKYGRVAAAHSGSRCSRSARAQGRYATPRGYAPPESTAMVAFGNQC